ncbi:MoaD/ThiS family protein [Romboutsia sp.]|uniref:MoaD/ThiS family protein n=1 Tax=Romboutsia sp. TaxID=1965302 RepID=UPI003F3F0AED
MKINNIEISLDEDITIIEMLTYISEDKRFSQLSKFNKLIFLNDKIVEEVNYNSIKLSKEDNIKIVPLLAGG